MGSISNEGIMILIMIIIIIKIINSNVVIIKQIHTPKISPKMLLISILWAKK